MNAFPTRVNTVIVLMSSAHFLAVAMTVMLAPCVLMKLMNVYLTRALMASAQITLRPTRVRAVTVIRDRSV